MRAVSLADVVPLFLAEFRFPDHDPLAGEEGVVMGYAVRHPRGVLLVDTGIGFGHEWVDQAYRPRSRRVREVLAKAGVDATDVTAIVNSHLHFDHSGQNSAFPGVPIYVQEAEWEVAHSTEHTVLEWVDFPGARYERVAGDHDLLPGMRIIATPGHTIGHQSVVVESQEGNVIVAGQAVYTRGEWAGVTGAWDGASRAWNRAAYEESVDRLRRLNPIRVFFGHDRRAWSR